MELGKILIVDDKQANLLSLEAVLDGMAVEILRANSGKEALDIAYREELVLILLDVQMPEMDGFETARYLKQVKKTRDIPIIFVTAISKDEKHVFKGYTVGAVDYLFKPFDPYLLISKVKVFLQLAESKKELEKKAAQLQETVLSLQQTKKKLEKSQQALDNAQKIAQLGNWVFNLRNNEFSCSAEIYRLFDLEPDTVLSGYGQLLAAVPENERQELIGLINNAVIKADPYILEHRIIRKDGNERTVLEMGEVFFDQDSHPEYLISTIHDITQWRQTEDRLQLVENVLKTANEGVVVTDADTVIESINPSFSRITGYTAIEAIGQKPSILKSDHHDKWFFQKMWKELNETGKWYGEIWNRRKNGDAYPQSLSITEIKGRDNRVTNYIGVFADISDLKRGEEELRYQANHDVLTGLPNRSLFMDRLRQAISLESEQAGLAVLLFSLDHFKKINDSLGPNAGDILLIKIAERGLEFLGERFSFSRLGGDEYALILHETVKVEQIVHFIEDFTNFLFKPFWVMDHELHVTASIGISIFPCDSGDPEILFRNANLAMHRAKEKGRNQYQFFTSTMDEEAAKRLRLEGAMRKGLEVNDFYLVYQPKISTDTGRVVGMEALVRWRHPESGYVSPADFIPIAEETGLIIPLGIWIMKEACRQCKEWLAQGHNLRISVNLSAKQFQSPTLIDDIKSVLQKTKLPAANLELEITESMVMGDMDIVIDTLQQLKYLQLFISMDDFGTGYSSLSYLKRLPIDTLKIDQSFIRDLVVDSEDAAIVLAIIAMAKSMNMKVIAEGVENEAQVEFLRANSCDELQGFWYSKPLLPGEFVQFVAEANG